MKELLKRIRLGVFFMLITCMAKPDVDPVLQLLMVGTIERQTAF